MCNPWKSPRKSQKFQINVRVTRTMSPRKFQKSQINVRVSPRKFQKSQINTLWMTTRGLMSTTITPTGINKNDFIRVRYFH